jgi:hypothetical protein
MTAAAVPVSNGGTIKCRRCNYQWVSVKLLLTHEHPGCCPNCRTTHPYYLRKRRWVRSVHKPEDRRTFIEPAK